MGRSASVFNKKSRERVARSKKTLGSAVKRVTPTVPQAHAIVQANPNAPQNRPPMDRGNESPLERIGRFVTNVGVGGQGTIKSYSTDIIDSVGSAITGSDSEVLDRRIKDRTLVDAYITSAMEGNLDPAFKETQRRLVEQPGRVVGEVATETAIMLGTMGLGAVVTGGKAAVMAGSKVPMVLGKGAVTAAGPGTGAMLKTGRTLRGAKTFEHRQWNLADKSLTITKGKGDKVTSTTTKKIGKMDRLEIYGSEIGTKIHKASPRVHVPGLHKIRNFYGLGNAGIALDSTKEAIPRTLGTGKTQYLSKTAAGNFAGKFVEIPTKTGSINTRVKMKGLAKFRAYILEPTSTLLNIREGKRTPFDAGNWARESASMGTTGIKGDAVETVMRTGDDGLGEAGGARGFYSQGADDVTEAALNRGSSGAGQRNFRNSNDANKFLMKIGASGELDSSTITAGVNITKDEAKDITDRFLYKIRQESNISVEDVKLIKTGKKGAENTYEVSINAVDTVIVKAKNVKEAAREVSVTPEFHPSIQNQPTGTTRSDMEQLRNWFGQVDAQSTAQKISNLAKHDNVIFAAKKAGVTPEEYASVLTKNGYNSPASEIGGTFNIAQLNDAFVARDLSVVGSPARYVRSVKGTPDEITRKDFSYQVSPGSAYRTKDNVSTSGASVEAMEQNLKNLLGPQAKDLPRPFGKKLVGGKFVDDRFKSDVINWSASRKIARELINPKTGKKYTSDEVGKLMPLNPEKKPPMISADDFRKHTFDTQFSYSADDAKSFDKLAITSNNKEATKKLLSILQDKHNLNAAIRKTDKQIKERATKSATDSLRVSKKKIKKLPLAQRLEINKARKVQIKKNLKVYKEAFPDYLKNAKEAIPGKKEWQYKADAHEAMQKDGLPVFNKNNRPSNEWHDKWNKATLEEIQDISETYNPSDPLNARSLFVKTTIDNAGKKSVSEIKDSYKSQNFLPTEPEKMSFGTRVGEEKNIIDTLASTKDIPGSQSMPSLMDTFRQEKALRKTKSWKNRPSWEGRIKNPTTGKRGQLGTSMADLSKLYLPGVVSGLRVGSKTSKRKTTFREEPNLYDAYMGKAGRTKDRPNRMNRDYNNIIGYETTVKAPTKFGPFLLDTNPGKFIKPKSSKEIKIIRDNQYRQVALSKKPNKRKWSTIDPAVNMANNFDDIVRVTKKRENTRQFRNLFSGYLSP